MPFHRILKNKLWQIRLWTRRCELKYLRQLEQNNFLSWFIGICPRPAQPHKWQAARKKIPFKLFPRDWTLQLETVGRKKQRMLCSRFSKVKMEFLWLHWVSPLHTTPLQQHSDLHQFSPHQQSKVRCGENWQKIDKKRRLTSSKIFLLIIIICPMGAKAPSTQMCSAVLYLKLSSKNDPLFTKRDIICKYTMALWIYSYMRKNMHICAYVCYDAVICVLWTLCHDGELIPVLIWSCQNLCCQPHCFVWPSSCDPPCEHQEQLI